MIQHSDEWYEARMGRITASRVQDILPGKKGAYLKTREKYMIELASEILTGEMKELPPIKAVMNGINTEPLARSAYEIMTGLTVEEVGFIVHPEMDFLGASPDGLVEDESTLGGIEIKCPEATTLITLKNDEKIKPVYLTQMYIGMMCTEREWWDYFVYVPTMPDDKGYYCKRVYRDEEVVKTLTSEVKKFKEDLDKMIERM